MMQQLSDEGRQRLSEIANRYGVSFDAVEHLLWAVMAGQGNQAQFNHPDLGGMGQWSLGGMIMVGDMFNNGLKARVDGLCTELSNLVRSTSGLMQASSSFQSQSQGGNYGNQQNWNGGGVSLFVPGSVNAGNWWPQEIGFPASTGAQNNLRYAFFPASRRLAIDLGGAVSVYDTGDHNIGGFSQQQGGDQSLSFTSQYGLVRVADLPLVSGGNSAPQPMQAAPVYEPGAPVYGAPAAPSGDQPAPIAPVEQPSPVASPAYEAPVVNYAPEPVFAPEPVPAPVADVPVQAAAVTAMPSGSADDVFDKIERVASLHAKGILTDSEFQTKKAELLARL